MLHPENYQQECIPVGCVTYIVSGAVTAGGVCPGGGCLPGEGVSQHALRGTPPPVDRMTDRCKNITLPKFRCGR